MKKNVFYSVMMGVMMGVMMLTTACSSDDELATSEVDASSSRRAIASGGTKTVLVNMAGRNDLSVALPDDLDELKEGSRHIADNQNLLVFVRDYDSAPQPWLARIKNGAVTDSVSLSDMGIVSTDGDNRASDPAVMEGVIKYAYNHYPATSGDYGLVLWGHGSWWLMMDEVDRGTSRAFGMDLGSYRYSRDRRWINIPTLANILKDVPHLKFIMGDCCNLMCLENLYELRNVCDYIIGSPAEIPGRGAPYDEIVGDFFSDGNFCSSIIEKYYRSVGEALPLTAVKTSEMEHLLGCRQLHDDLCLERGLPAVAPGSGPGHR